MKSNLDKRIASLVKIRSTIFFAVRAAIYSFGTTLIVPWKRDVTLPCQSVGKPEPSVTWKQWGQVVKPSARVSLHADGSLQIIDLHREDSGNYTCFVDNRHGSDQITHRLTVQGEPNFLVRVILQNNFSKLVIIDFFLFLCEQNSFLVRE